MPHGIYEVTVRIRLNCDEEPETVRDMIDSAQFLPGSQSDVLIEQLDVIGIDPDD